MTDSGSLSLLLEQLKTGEESALQPLWERHFSRIVEMAHRQLRGRAVGLADAEDVALSALDSFHRGIGRGRFPRLCDRDDFWQVVMLLIRQKASNLLRDEKRQKRGGGKVHHFSALPSGESGSGEEAFAHCAGSAPCPAIAAEAADALHQWFDLLDDETLRTIAVLKMEGYSNEEIAGQQECSVATVERRLNLIRKIWSRSIHERQLST